MQFVYETGAQVGLIDEKKPERKSHSAVPLMCPFKPSVLMMLFDAKYIKMVWFVVWYGLVCGLIFFLFI